MAGTVGYRPDPVEAPADGNVLICCSHPEGDIAIDFSCGLICDPHKTIEDFKCDPDIVHRLTA